MTPEAIKKLLKLEPHPEEGGFFYETYRSTESTRWAGADYDGPRCAATAIYYLLTPDTFSALHRLKSDEIFHHYLGDPVEMLHLHPDGTTAAVTLGSDLAQGMRPQVVVPKGVWQGARLTDGGRFALLGCTVAPGFEFADYDHGDRTALTMAYPDAADAIARLTAE